MIINMKLVNFFTMIVLLTSSFTRCEDEEEMDREKRTIGTLFRTFVEAVFPPSQRQQAPEVISYQPLRPQRQQGNGPKQQSTKADLLLSSQRFIDEKKRKLMKNPSTQPPETEIFYPSKPPPPVNTVPSAPTQPVTQATQYYQPQPQQHPSVQQTTLHQTPALNPISNHLPHVSHHPSTPFKAQILILPLQHQTPPLLPFNFPIDPRLPNVSPLNYQAELYLQPPTQGVISAADFAARYSPRNGWHDVDEILRGGIHSPSGNDKDNAGVSLPKHDRVELTTYNVHQVTTEASTKYPEQSAATSRPTGDNEVDGQRRDSEHNYQHQDKLNLIQPLFSPNYQVPQPPVINLGLFDKQEGKYLAPPLGLGQYNQGFQQPIDEAHKAFITELMKNLEIQHLNIQKGGTSVSAHGESGHINNHDFTPQRADNKYGEHAQQNYYQQEQHNQNNYYNQQQQPTQQENQHQPKIGRLPDSLVEYHHQYPQNPHQTPPVYDSHIDSIEHSASHLDNNYYKRSNRAETHANN